ncbi:hypothetical protein [Paenibacillus sp. NEAU-GSW1]|uniref:hypothetical protein n=1 Tax=Paenibacillus sp. NEAU-GSW1 TaxID=2682486 RepID=UPI0012E1F46B|nr:hypothetical protein [Paenibacillus sp. NEAU-GSW1]MUT68301.1 hypothetical protein [Paenibacillus sp. NEAU-GSW1]
MSKTRVNVLKGTALFIAIVQIGLGLGYLFAPHAFHASVGLENLPDWAGWPLAMSGARFLLFGFGMIQVFRNPLGNRSWIQAMIGVQLIDWIGTIYYVASGAVTLSQVTTAAYLPILFIVMLLAAYPKEQTQSQALSK